ncbi:hypothetical protein RJ640_003239 [Escallonia rubra]|uniref:Haloacid dehalogenase superfamily protein n=1 Tax=Escallonia rubra TaxID=112253 RepID=A0AA88RAQ0_9ASTE|nr:hypothetical protein RJ640_003239 [Escallonia rubra]
MLEMQSTSIAPWHVCYYPIPNRFQFHHLHLSKKNTNSTISTCYQSLTIQTHSPNTSSFSHTNSCSKEQEKASRNNNNDNNKNNASYPRQNDAFMKQLYSSIETSKTQNSKIPNKKGKGEPESAVISTSMWWAKLKAAVGQNINLEGLACAASVVTRDNHLVLPHVFVPDIRHIDWAVLRREGFQGVVFDKDNTITVPYSLALWSPLDSSMEHCKSVFGNNIAVFSNSAGLLEYDPDGRKARALEYAIGIRVIRHKLKKPAGAAEEIERHFGCESSKLIMVGDRPFTDIVFGNRNGFLTVLTEPLSLAEEPFIVKQVRKLEVALVKRWSKKGFKPTNHRLLPDTMQCVKDPRLL